MSSPQTSLGRSFCPLPWIHLSANSDSSMRVCCNTGHGGRILDENDQPTFLGNLTSLNSAMNQKTSKDLRAAMLRGERPGFCRRCYEQEDAGGFSIRQVYNRQYETTLADALKMTTADGEIDAKVRYVDFQLSNNCNLQCRMCDPGASILLEKEFRALGDSYSPEWISAARNSWNFEGNLGRVVRELAPHVNQILTTGGEPFISQQHIKILETCIEQGRAREILLRYHSNLMVLPERLVDLWCHFKHIHVNVSLEGVGAMNDYVRHPSKWVKIQENLCKLQLLSTRMPIKAEIHTCLQAISWLRTSELIEWTIETSKRLRDLIPAVPFPIWLEHPEVLSVNCLPPELRRLGGERILRVLDRHQAWFEQRARDEGRERPEVTSSASFRAAIGTLEGTAYREEDFQAFIRRTRAVDQYRKQDVTSQVPEFKTYFERMTTSPAASAEL